MAGTGNACFMSHFAQLAAELCNGGAVDGAVLAPLGCDYHSADTRLGGLTALARFVCCAVAVESVLPALRQVVCVDVALHDQTTSAITAALRDWAGRRSVELVWVPEDAPIAWPAPPADFVPCVSTLTSCDVSARLSAGRGVDALVPPAVLSLLRRYGLYAGAAEPVGSHAMAWFVDGARASSTATRTRRVALFGGSFSPFTNGHGDAAAELLNCERVDEVWVVPCGPRPDKPSLRVSAVHRFALCVLAIEASFPASAPVYAVPVELPFPAALPTVELLALLEATHKDIAFTVVVGQDLVAALPTWASADTLRRSARLLVLPRLGGSAPVDSGVEVLAHPDAGAAVQSTAASSTEVRRRLAHHQRCDGLLPVFVQSFLERTALYGSGDCVHGCS